MFFLIEKIEILWAVLDLPKPILVLLHYIWAGLAGKSKTTPTILIFQLFWVKTVHFMWKTLRSKVHIFVKYFPADSWSDTSLTFWNSTILQIFRTFPSFQTSCNDCWIQNSLSFEIRVRSMIYFSCSWYEFKFINLIIYFLFCRIYLSMRRIILLNTSIQW